MALPSSKGSYHLWGKDSKDVDKFPVTPQLSQGHQHRNDERVEQEQEQEQNTATDKQDELERGQWGHKAEFILSCIGLSVGLGNIWRFPYLAYKYGGAAFLIAYLILQLLIGKPLYFMELVLGQYTGKGPTKCWELNPAAKGIGIAMCMVSLVVSIYYNIIVAYTIYYLFSSMQGTLPWTECKPEWGPCVPKRDHPAPPSCTTNYTAMAILGNCTCTKNETIDTALGFNCTPTYTTATELFFYKEVIQKSEGIEPEKMGAPLWKIALSLLLAWILVAVCLAKGIKTSGKVVYFTATFPYVVLLILLIRGSLLEGAVDGVLFFIVPKWEQLTDISVWVAAAGQMFFSLSVSFGGIIMFGSYNKFTNQLHGDAVVVSSMDLVTSVIAGFVVFTTFGHMGRLAGIPIEQVAQSGYGLAFVAYPEALSNLPVPQLWSVIFFFMLFLLGLDSEFGLMETVLTCVHDEFPQLRKWKVQVCLLSSLACYFMALPCTCPGGDYVVTLMDHYGGDFAVLFLSFFEVISVMWVYGVMRFLKDIEYMLGHCPSLWPYWVGCWAVFSPLLIAFMFTYRMINYEPPTIHGAVPFPPFAQAIGWTLLSVVLCPIPLWLIFHTIRTCKKNKHLSGLQVIKKIFGPTKRWMPADGSKSYVDSCSDQEMETKSGVDNPAVSMQL